MIKLAIDAMGGDFAPQITLEGAILAVKDFKDLELVLYGDQTILEKQLAQLKVNQTKDHTFLERITIINSPTQISMGEKDPVAAIRRHRDSSLVMAFKAVKDKTVDGVVTAGPTQAVIVAAHIITKRLNQMKRVALCPSVPSFKKTGALILDVGANTTIEAHHMVQYGMFAVKYAQTVKKIPNPKVYLLNIGAEPGKGRELEKEVYQKLEAADLNFCGNLEPKELLTSDADIIITDGFTGNIAMKTFEGAAKAMGLALKEDITSSFLGKIGGLLMRKNLKKFKNRFNPDLVGGAILFGVDGVVIKAHGSSSGFAFYNAIKLAYSVVSGEVINQMKQYLDEHPLEEKGTNNE